jgi:hypothetical protein
VLLVVVMQREHHCEQIRTKLHQSAHEFSKSTERGTGRGGGKEEGS